MGPCGMPPGLVPSSVATPIAWCDELFPGWDYFLWIYFFRVSCQHVNDPIYMSQPHRFSNKEFFYFFKKRTDEVKKFEEPLKLLSDVKIFFFKKKSSHSMDN